MVKKSSKSKTDSDVHSSGNEGDPDELNVGKPDKKGKKSKKEKKSKKSKASKKAKTPKSKKTKTARSKQSKKSKKSKKGKARSKSPYDSQTDSALSEPQRSAGGKDAKKKDKKGKKDKKDKKGAKSKTSTSSAHSKGTTSTGHSKKKKGGSKICGAKSKKSKKSKSKSRSKSSKSSKKSGMSKGKKSKRDKKKSKREKSHSKSQSEQQSKTSQATRTGGTTGSGTTDDERAFMACSYWKRAASKKNANTLLVLIRSAERVDRLFGNEWPVTEAPYGYVEPGLLEPLTWYRTGNKKLPDFRLDELSKYYPIDTGYSPVMTMESISRVFDIETEMQGIGRVDFVLRSLAGEQRNESLVIVGHAITLAAGTALCNPPSAEGNQSSDWHANIDMLDGDVVDQVSLGLRFPPGSVIVLKQASKEGPPSYQLTPDVVPPLSYGETFSNKPIIEA
ncbi:unnamed protein product [Nippostrongylus brasiliensis]|uniref:Mab-21 domain-containing protein n=1 Tax=Nippostrongylus brasiliensis TaxID=27835 RepID=A0A0N4YN74_NIPBR|nr:unnamed protein product [Nippostrongylus brasiliensis]